jgi:tetratricopeptide (TPR) repeat protein
LALAQIQNPAENFLKAIGAARKALEIFNRESNPEEYAESQGILWLGYLTLADIEYRAENCLLALEACQERLIAFSQGKPLQYASCQKDLAITYSMLADTEVSVEAKAEDCRKGAEAALEALSIYNESDHPIEHAEAQLLLWAAYSALAEVEEKEENCRKAIDACQAAVRIYEASHPTEHADALKSLGYSFITLAEVTDKAKNCRRAIEACSASLEHYQKDEAPREHAEILRDLAFAYVTISEVEDREEWVKRGLRAYKKASRIFEGVAQELEAERDPEAAEMRNDVQRCRRSMQSCKGILKASRKRRSEDQILESR